MAKRADRNQAEIVEALRGIGALVQHLHEVGHGCPDLLVAYKGKMTLLEVKDWQQPPSKRKLTPDEKAWHSLWAGYVKVVETVAEAFEAIGAQITLFEK